MSFPRYEAYKDSGVEWLGEVPEHWVVKSYRYSSVIYRGKFGHRPRNDPSLYDGNFAFIQTGDIARARRYIKSYQQTLNQKGAAVSQKFPAGTLVMAIAANIGDTALLSFEAYAPDSVVGFRPRNDVEIEFLRFSFMAAIQELHKTSTQSTQANLNIERIGSIRAVFPSFSEQQEIANYLNRETARIDALIAEQERLIELLKEKRQAVISHAVTKGLDPTAPMKDSGVEWLGEVPEHWEVTRLKFIMERIVDCPHETPIYDPEGDYLVIRTADIDQGELKTQQMYHLDHDEYLNRIRREPLLQNDIVYGREGERWGHAALVPTSNLFALGQRMMQFRTDKNICPLCLMFQLNSVSTYRQGEVDTVGATSPHVNISTIRNYQLIVPPPEEQKQISRYLLDITETLDSLVEEATNTADILQERRSALISAAVTGKIDVRGWQAPTNASPANC